MAEVQTGAESLKSVHTTSLSEVLKQFGISLLVSTYQAGKLVVIREDGGTTNTHFRNFNTPMGLAFDRGRLAIGTKNSVWEFCDQPAAAKKLAPENKHDALFLPRYKHTTGHIAIHEMEYSDDELWFINTRYSCICTLDRKYSFVPRWRPKFVTQLTVEDRCHLNGFTLVNGVPRYVTALGATDSNEAWRASKANGGVLIDIPSGEFVSRGLSMPHSPRWREGQLWICESGAGSLSKVNIATGKLEHIALLPGFTRGLDFFGNLAFIGLSQVRETAIFSGIPITERLPVEQRKCGVWVVNINTGETVAFLQFESGVQEIFAVRVLPQMRYPDLLNDDNEDPISNSFILPDEALKDVPNAVFV